ncbi:MAG: hypothetical protein JO131_06400 [Gammaproteobacteria bacterium]|nr:hypothetical protein [Gammaproteobacteria bacterium]
MNSQSPANSLSHLRTQWITRFENQKKKIASEEKITEMKFGPNITYYIQHTAENALSSSDKRRFALSQYKNLTRLIDHLAKEEKPDEINQLLERTKHSLQESQKKFSPGLQKMGQLLNEFQKELIIILSQKKSQPSDEFKR